MTKFYKALVIFLLVTAPLYLIWKSYTMFFINLTIGLITLYFANKGFYGSLFKKSYIPTPNNIKEHPYKIIEVKRNQAYAYYIDYLFSTHKYKTMNKSDYNKNEYVGFSVYKYKFDDINCGLIENGKFYDVRVVTPIGSETIGTIPKHKITTNEYSKGKFKLATEGGKGWMIYQDEDSLIKWSEEKFFPYIMAIKVEFDIGNYDK